MGTDRSDLTTSHPPRRLDLEPQGRDIFEMSSQVIRLGGEIYLQ